MLWHSGPIWLVLWKKCCFVTVKLYWECIIFFFSFFSILYCVSIHVVYVGQVVGGGVVVSFVVICVILVLGFLMCVGSSQCEMGCPSIFCASLQLFWMFFVMYFGRRESGGGLFLIWGLNLVFKPINNPFKKD